ncbi:tyrosine-protein kinase hopscotch [Bacillus rossius redtenbacheri]|uniref:tyrosine-protein kinase hopscotch n=1 Tax=Bacillus rossius redtenbacheri TaxID=93214 RepID=UPI002FDD9828
MEAVVKYARVYAYVIEDFLKIPLTSLTTAEEVCVKLAKELGIGPRARHLFSLRLRGGKNVWFSPGSRLSEARPDSEYEFRLRFKVPDSETLKRTDIKAYDYYFHQVRSDLVNNKIPDISYERYKSELVGLGVADMYRVMLEKGLDRQAVESNYKKYIPKEVIKHHLFFVKKPIHETLGKIRKDGRHDAWYVKAVYLKQFEDMAANYPSEEFRALMDEAGAVKSIWLRVAPFHEAQPGVAYRYGEKKEWLHLCSIEDLCFISVRNDSTVEISRKNGIPSYLIFSSIPEMFTFVNLLDGYYRLMVKWTFNLCKDVSTPSLQQLHSWKCHGPIGGEFSYAKLEEKRGNQPGCYILRESETKYDVYYLDVCTSSSAKPTSHRIDRLEDGQYLFCADNKKYDTLPRLVLAYKTPHGELQECLPPSEYDKSPLLLCAADSETVKDTLESVVSGLQSAQPVCIDVQDLQVYKSQKKEGKEGITVVYRSVWKVSKGKKVEVAMKILKQENRDKYLKEFLELAGRWAFLQSNSIVKLFGVTLASPFAMVMEYLQLGPLDRYLAEHKPDLKPVDLVEAAGYLATALWHLEDRGIVHGNIRCHKLLVANHSENTFLVRLADPGFHTYTTSDIHWIPVECYHNFAVARASTAADVWSFGTTLWEIFTFGSVPIDIGSVEAVKKFYLSNKKLGQPSDCPPNMYRLMLECWDLDVYRRKKPQAIMRDVNQILYQVFNSRRTHTYATALPKLFNRTSDSSSKLSLFSGVTEETYIGDSKSDLISLGCNEDSDIANINGLSSPANSTEGAWLLGNFQSSSPLEDFATPDFSTMFSTFTFPIVNTSVDSITSMQGIFELDSNCNVVLQGRIGQGFYGEVFRGTMERDDCEPQLVAVKKLKGDAMGAVLQDFEREISIMKALKHENIVEIKGVILEPEISLVMEYVQHGSLQSFLKIHKESLTKRQLLKFALDVAKGMEYLGRKNIVHRDLAARNILVANENHVKISDFGLAQVMEKNDYYILKTSRDLPIKWYAPESLRDGKFSPRSDVWSYGVTLFEMFSRGEDPQLGGCEQDQQQLLAALEGGIRLPCPPLCPQTVYVQLMTPCWQADTHARPSFPEICAIVQDMQANLC